MKKQIGYYKNQIAKFINMIIKQQSAPPTTTNMMREQILQENDFPLKTHSPTAAYATSIFTDKCPNLTPLGRSHSNMTNNRKGDSKSIDFYRFLRLQHYFCSLTCVMSFND